MYPTFLSLKEECGRCVDKAHPGEPGPANEGAAGVRRLRWRERQHAHARAQSPQNIERREPHGKSRGWLVESLWEWLAPFRLTVYVVDVLRSDRPTDTRQYSGFMRRSVPAS